jgi:serine/threonine protein kinase
MDISLNNIMKDDSKHLVLIDFAFARHSSEQKEGGGTPGYIAPEIYLGQIPTFSSDIYSTGVILGQLLELYIPGLSLHYLGSKLVRSATTTYICRKIEQLKEDSIDLDLVLVYAADLLYLMLQEDPEKRISAKEMLKHPFITSDSQMFEKFKYKDQTRKLLHSPVTKRAPARKEPIVLYRGM